LYETGEKGPPEKFWRDIDPGGEYPRRKEEDVEKSFQQVSS